VGVRAASGSPGIGGFCQEVRGGAAASEEKKGKKITENGPKVEGRKWWYGKTNVRSSPGGWQREKEIRAKERLGRENGGGTSFEVRSSRGPSCKKRIT